MPVAPPTDDPPQDDPDRVTYIPTYEDLLAANRLVYRPTRRRLATYALLTAIGAANVTLSLLGPATDRTPDLAFGIALMLFAPAWRLLLRLWLLPVYTRRYHAQAAILREEFIVGWDQAGLDSRTRRTTNLVPWEDYIARREDASTLLFYQTDAMFQFLPKRVLTPAQVARLRLLSEAVPERRWASLWPGRSREGG